MYLKEIALAAFVAGMPYPALAQINAPVPVANYITFGGLDWAWASPCPPSGSAGGTTCGSGAAVDFTYQGTQGWRLPTAAELAAGPAVTDFGTAVAFACASAWFTSAYTHCDYGDAAGGAVFGAPGGGNWYDETWVIRGGAGGIPEPAAWGMLIGGFALAGAAMRHRSIRVANPA